MKHFIVFLLIILTTTLTSCRQEVDVYAEAEKLLEIDREFAASSLEVGAADAFRQYMAEDAVQMPNGSYPVFGRDAIYEWMRGDDDVYTLSWQPIDAAVAASGDMGWTLGDWKFTGKNIDGEDVTVYGKYVNVWKKVDGQWKVMIDIGNTSPAPDQN
jgi:ketosteroid isomerase-like protein